MTLPFTAPRDRTFEAKVRKAEAKDVVERGGVVLFWGGHMSQWYPSQFVIEGVKYSCAEQYMMAEKARLFGDAVALKRILLEKYPKAMKEIGREVTPFSAAKWDAVSRHAVFRANLAKYSQNPALRDQLLRTGDAPIGEASPYDDVWGIGKSMKARGAFTASTWKGKNWLGEALMHVRARLRRDAQARLRRPNAPEIVVTPTTRDPALAKAHKTKPAKARSGSKAKSAPRRKPRSGSRAKAVGRGKPTRR